MKDFFADIIILILASKQILFYMIIFHLGLRCNEILRQISKYVRSVIVYIPCNEFFTTIEKIKLNNVNKSVIYNFLMENGIYIDYARRILSGKYCNILLHDKILKKRNK